jgi:hypothetical protein
MKKILIILTGVLLVYSEPVLANNEITGIAIAKKVTKVKKKTSRKKRIVKKTKKTVKKKTSRQKRTTKRVRFNVGEIQSYMHQLVVEYGWSEEDYYSWIMIVKRESSFNPYAVNKKSKATGLCQALPGKKMASHGKDWRTNYKTQLRWCRDYIKYRYSTPNQAWAFWQSHHWF